MRPKKEKGVKACFGLKLSLPGASCYFSVLVSILLHAHRAVADSVCGKFVSSLSATVLCLVAVAVTVLGSQSFSFLCLKHGTVAVAVVRSESALVFCLK